MTDPQAFPDSSGDWIEPTPEAYIKAALPILLVSRKVVLIDPYFSLHFCDKNSKKTYLDRGKRKLLSMFLSTAVEGNQVEAFEIFYSPRKTGFMIEEQKEALNLILREIRSIKQIDINIHSLDEKHPQQHDRFLLGLKNGLSFGYGFGVGNKKKNQVSWVGKAILTPLLEEFT